MTKDTTANVGIRTQSRIYFFISFGHNHNCVVEVEEIILDC